MNSSSKRTMLSSLFAVALVALAHATAKAQTLQGKLWVVSPSQAGNLAFPPPSATPDATFKTPGMAYIGQNTAQHCYSIGRFLGGCGTSVQHLVFSGLANPYLGGVAASGGTLMGGPNYGVIIEFTGQTSLSNGQTVSIFHDDGVAVKIDTVPLSGFSTGVGISLESEVFTGSSGTHNLDLLYANAGCCGAWLLFFPHLF